MRINASIENASIEPEAAAAMFDEMLTRLYPGATRWPGASVGAGDEDSHPLQQEETL